MNKITIFGSYSKNSVGDKAILISLLDLIARSKKYHVQIDVLAYDKKTIENEIKEYTWKNQVKVIPIVKNLSSLKKKPKFKYSKIIFNKLPNFLKTTIGLYTFKKLMNNYEYKNSDGLIIGGGNLLMDLYPTWPGRPFTIQNNFLKENKPTYLLGVGALPINNFISKKLIKKTISRAEKVFVRDKRSQKYITENLKEKAEFKPDLAFSFPLKKINKTSRNSIVCAVNTAPLYGKDWPIKDKKKYKFYIRSVSKELYLFYKTRPKVSYVFFDTNYPLDSTSTKEIIDNLIRLGYPPEKISYEDKLHTCLEICTIINKADLVVTTRLHAAILSLISGKPIVALRYQPKVEEVLKSSGLNAQAILNIDEIKEMHHRLESITHKKAFFLKKEQLEYSNKINEENSREHPVFTTNEKF